MRTFALLILGLFVSQSAVAQTPSPILFDRQSLSEQGIDISQQTLFYDDPTNDTLATVASIRQKRFIPRSASPTFHHDNDLKKSTYVFWLQFQITNTHPSDTLHLWYHSGVHSIVSLYDSTGKLIGKGGLFATVEGLQEDIPLMVLPQTTHHYYVRLVDYIRFVVTEQDLVYSPQGYERVRAQTASNNKWLLISMSMMVGCFFLMGLYTLFQYYLNHDTTYLYYALYAGISFCHIVKMGNPRLELGLTPSFLPQLMNPSLANLSYSISFFYALFLSKLLNLRSQQPTFWRVIRVLMGLLLAQQLMAFVEVFTGPWFSNNTYYLMSDTSGMVTGWILIIAIVRSRSPLKTYLLAGSIGLFIISVSPLHGFYSFLMLPQKIRSFVAYGPFNMALGLVIELFYFALALAYRNRLTELENASLHTTYTHQLEEQLAQRTEEIQTQSQQLEAQHIRQLELGFEQKLAETEMTALRAQMNPHFIFNCLNSIKLYATENDATKAADYLTKFSRLIRLVLENSRSERVTLQNELDALKLYLDMEAMRFKDKLRFRIIVDETIDTEFVEIPPLLLQPYVENAIWHGLMHKLEGGMVVVRVEQPKDDRLLVTITDDGIGRALATELKSKSAMPKKSFGMKVTGERIALINQLYQMHTNVQIHDLIDSQGQPAGTEVMLEIPV